MRPSSTRRPSAEAVIGLRRGLLLAGFLHQQLHLVRALRALADPFLDLGDVQLQALVRTGSTRVEITQARDVAAVTGAARIGHHHVVERPALGACARKTNLYHVLLTLKVRPERSAGRAARARETGNCSGTGTKSQP